MKQKILHSYKQNRFFAFWDFVFIIVSSVGTMSMVQFVTYNVLPVPACVSLFLFTLLAYFVRFGGKFVGFGFLKKSTLFILLTLLYLWEILQGLMFVDVGSVVVRFIFLISAYICCSYINGLLKNGQSINYILKPYCYYAIYVLVTMIVLSALIYLGIISPYSNVMDHNALIADNVDYHDYFFPGFLSIVIRTPSVFFENKLPTICGLSHEPQLNCFATIPALILLILIYKNKKYIEYKAFGLVFLLCILSTSFTGIVSFLAVLLLHVAWNFVINRKFSHVLLLAIALILFFCLIVSLDYYDKFIALMEVKADFDNAGSSGSKSLGLLEYITSSTSILGEGIFCSYEDIKTGGHNNIGYISSFIIVVFYICMLVASLSNLLSRKFICHVIGLATTYFCLHSLKYGIVLFKYNYLFFIVLILAYSNCYKKNCLKLLY